MAGRKKETKETGTAITLEIKRQMFHIAFGLAIALLFAANMIDWELLSVVLVVGLIVSLLSTKYKLPIISWFLKNFERRKVKLPGKGALSLLAGILLAIIIFEKNTALAAIMVVTLGDSLSHITGKLFGKTKNPLNKYKLIEGSFMGFVFGAAGASLFVLWQHAIAASAVAMIVESIEIKFKQVIVDDNLVLPLVAGTVIYLIQMYFSYRKLHNFLIFLHNLQAHSYNSEVDYYNSLHHYYSY